MMVELKRKIGVFKFSSEGQPRAKYSHSGESSLV
ncbi:hypothetical protein AN390_01267 [Pseudoalteromonas sp. P1-11]|nr:hypothetical protein AN390_01267 [Pseudoalteromonas sp. P1-11]